MLQVDQKVSPFVYGNDVAVTLAFLGGMDVDIANQHALGSLHQSLGTDHLASLRGRDACLVDDSLQVRWTAAFSYVHHMVQVRLGQHLASALAQVMADDGKTLLPVGHAKVHLHLKAAHHGVIHLHRFAVEVAGHDPDDLGIVFAAHTIEHGQQCVCGVIVKLATTTAFHEQVLRLIKENNAALAPLGHGHNAAERIGAARYKARFQIGCGMKQDRQTQLFGQIARQLGLAGARRTTEHHIEGLADAILGIFCSALILVFDLRYFSLDVVHAH